MPNHVRQRILLAEDDEAQREILTELLEYEGYQVLTAATPDEVLVQLEGRPDAILLDVWGVSNASVLATLARMRERPACLLVSGDGSAGSIADRIGAEDFLTKPFEVDALLARLRRAIHRRHAAEESANFGAP